MGALHWGLLAVLAAAPDSYDFNGVQASATQVRPLGYFNGSDGFVSGVGSFTLGVTDHVRDDGFTYGDDAKLNARITVGADEYRVELSQAGFPPAQALTGDAKKGGPMPAAPRHALGGGVLLDRDVFGTTGIGVRDLTRARASIAVFGVGRVYKNGQLLTDRARVQATALPSGIFALQDGQLRMTRDPQVGHAEVMIVADNLPKGATPRGFLQFGFEDVQIVVGGAPVVAQAPAADTGRGTGGAGTARGASIGASTPGGVAPVTGAPGANDQMAPSLTPDVVSTTAGGTGAANAGTGGTGAANAGTGGTGAATGGGMANAATGGGMANAATGGSGTAGTGATAAGTGGVPAVTGAPGMNDQLAPALTPGSVSTSGGSAGVSTGGPGIASTTGASGSGGLAAGPFIGASPLVTGTTGGTALVPQAATPPTTETPSRDLSEALNGRRPITAVNPTALPSNAAAQPVPSTPVGLLGGIVSPAAPPAGTPAAPPAGTPGAPVAGTPAAPVAGTPAAPTAGTPGAPAVGTPGAPGAFGQATTGGAAVGGVPGTQADNLPGTPNSIASQTQVPGREGNAASAYSSIGIPATPQPLNAQAATPLPFAPSPLNATAPTGLPSTTTGTPVGTTTGTNGTVATVPSTTGTTAAPAPAAPVTGRGARAFFPAPVR